jgi:hypothetical protein
MNMIRRSVLAASMVAVCALSVPTMHASTVNLTPSVNAFFGNVKTVKLNVKNDTDTAIEIKAGEAVMTIQAGKVMAVNLPVGTRVMTTTATKSHVAGDLLFEVSSSLSGATVRIS